jgi:hypothetical protein
MVVLSQLAGPQGAVATTTARSKCMSEVFNFNSVAVNSIAIASPMKYYDTLITTNF